MISSKVVRVPTDFDLSRLDAMIQEVLHTRLKAQAQRLADEQIRGTSTIVAPAGLLRAMDRKPGL